MEYLSTIEIDPDTPAKASIIWLHGLGADGNDFVPIVSELELPDDMGVRFVFPNAPEMPVTINNGYVMPAWYDILSEDFFRKEDEEGIRNSATRIEDLIRHEIDRGIPAYRIILAGFSQGGAIALHTGLRYRKQLAGIMALSTYLPLADTLSMERVSENDNVPVMMAHGLYDPVVPFSVAQRSSEQLRTQGYDVELHEFEMEHTVCSAEIKAISDWIRKVLG